VGVDAGVREGTGGRWGRRGEEGKVRASVSMEFVLCPAILGS
jgi:hypothetical protein